MKNLLYLLLLVSSYSFSQKISDLPTANTPLGGTEQLPAVQSGTTKKVTAQNIADLITVTTLGLNNVDNTSDEDKPVSTAVQAALETVTKVLVTGTTILNSTAFGAWHVCSGTSADYTITLPTAVGNEGKMILFKGANDVTNLSKLVTIDADATEKINNSLTYAITTGGYLTIIARVTSGVGSWDIISFDQGAPYTWTPTWTGFSAGPTGTFTFKRGIRIVDISITGATGTGVGSDASISFTLPLGLTGSQSQRLLLPFFINNNVGSTVPGCIILAIGNNTVACYTTVAAGAWAGANNRYITGTWRFFTNE